ncbi:alkaline phosphatase family protein [Ornithinimicrobium cerasi]|uniref:alkaline phosphatase family protein n=1 Tax=Ornithinimicrobium cerasi TaxID=2248773 RepID=UPI000EFFFBAB|nr:alkaline phosphatase family protein [Ornithinimicrobium cerasi]
MGTTSRLLALGLAALLVGCTAPSGPSGPVLGSTSVTGPATPDATALPDAATTSDPAATSAGGAADAASSPTKVLLLMEENTQVGEVLGAGRTPYLEGVVGQAARVTDMQAGYPTLCPSLPAYLLLTSGSTHGVCNSDGPGSLQVEAPNLFEEVATSGREWRVYAEGMRTTCQRQDSDDGRYAVRHTAAPYYPSEAERCERWQVPLGDTEGGALREGLASGLPAFSLVVPDLCHDMHGGDACTGDRVEEGDAWLSRWLPRILGSSDYRSGDLLVVLTWDEGSTLSNDIATLVFHPVLAGTTVDRRTDHCDTLRTMSEVLDVPALGCAAQAVGLVEAEDLGLGLDRR